MTKIEVMIIISIVLIIVAVIGGYGYKLKLFDKMERGEKLTTFEKLMLISK